MGLKVYNVRLYKANEEITGTYDDYFWYVDGTSFEYNYVCNIFVVIELGKIYELTTNYHLMTQTDLSNYMYNNNKVKHKLNKPMGKYVISRNDLVEANLVSVDDIIKYFSNTESKWLKIYIEELRKSLPSEQASVLKFVKKMIGSMK
jgi:hypothetical protein